MKSHLKEEWEMSQEQKRLKSLSEKEIHPWKKWGAYVSERSWGSVREDYSPDGNAWASTTHDMSRSLAYRWGEDGIAGYCDFFQTIVFSCAFWNGNDRILKERIFGLSSLEGNHGEDVKEYYFYLDATPTGSYMKYLYKYPQGEFPYQKLIDENRKRGTQDREYELLDTGVFEENRYFDIFIEYAKAGPEDTVIRIEIFNRGPEAASIHVLPQLFFRNCWSWEKNCELLIPEIKEGLISKDFISFYADPSNLPPLSGVSFEYTREPINLYADPGAELLFTNNETNFKRLYNTENRTPYVKDAFHRHIIEKENCVNKEKTGTKAAFHYEVEILPGVSKVFHLRLTSEILKNPLKEVDKTILLRKKEADAFYNEIQSLKLSEDDKKIQRQAYAGMIWSKQFYHYRVQRWFEGDPAFAPPPESRENIRNNHWRHLNANMVISMPDKWEYPWFAAWDLCFHAVAFAKIDPALAKEQIHILLKHQYMHPNGQIPAYEWGFSDLNPPLQAWAALRVYRIDGSQDINFLEEVFLKLIMNFTWWVNKVDKEGNNFFEGGFLGLDNISVIDRSKSLKGGGQFEESDGTGWMGFFSLTMMRIALELTKKRSHFEGMALKFFEHFVYIAQALQISKGKEAPMWDDKDGFFYDVISYPDGRHEQLKIRSFVGLIPLYAVEFLDDDEMKQFPIFYANAHLFMREKEAACKTCIYPDQGKKGRYLLSLVNPNQIVKTFEKMWDPEEFFSPFGLRSISKFHEKNPLSFEGSSVGYEPGESLEKVKGGNSNWRGPVWMPTNFLMVESLLRYSEALGDEWKDLPFQKLIAKLRNCLIDLFRLTPENTRPTHGDYNIFNTDPHWKDLLLFYEHYHGDNGRGLGASHQTGWSGLVATLIDELYRS